MTKINTIIQYLIGKLILMCINHFQEEKSNGYMQLLINTRIYFW